MTTKLTLVSMYGNFRKVSRFVMAKIINGRAVIPNSVYMSMRKELNLQRGDTYSIG